MFVEHIVVAPLTHDNRSGNPVPVCSPACSALAEVIEEEEAAISAAGADKQDNGLNLLAHSEAILSLKGVCHDFSDCHHKGRRSARGLGGTCATLLREI